MSPTDQPDLQRLRRYRLDRVQAELRARDYDACLLYDPVNVRYATDSRNMAVWTMHNAVRFAILPADGRAIVFEFHGARHLNDGLDTVCDVRPAVGWDFFSAGPRQHEMAGHWATSVVEALADLKCGQRLAVDQLTPVGAAALGKHDIELFEAREVMETARLIKSADELAAMRHAIAAAAAGMARMREVLAPGISENELWSHLHQVNIAHGGEWIETRLLSSGPRTNPWFQEAGDRVIEAGDLVSFDTDLIGPYGYCADISRCFLCGDGPASDDQRRLYAMAVEQIEHNLPLFQAGAGYREIIEKAYPLPEAFAPNRYSCIAHGVGLCDEYPLLPYPQEFARFGHDGELRPDMTLCVESYIGAVGGHEGVKLEQQILITPDGPELLSTFPLEPALL